MCVCGSVCAHVSCLNGVLLCVYVHVFICVYVHVHVCLCVYMCMCVCVRFHMCVFEDVVYVWVWLVGTDIAPPTVPIQLFTPHTIYIHTVLS